MKKLGLLASCLVSLCSALPAIACDEAIKMDTAERAVSFIVGINVNAGMTPNLFEMLEDVNRFKINSNHSTDGSTYSVQIRKRKDVLPSWEVKIDPMTCKVLSVKKNLE